MIKLMRRLVLSFALMAALAACSGHKEVRGNFLTEAQIAGVTVGKTTRRDVIRQLGPPSTEGTFDSQVWYYIGRQTKRVAFFKPDVTAQQVVAVYFDDAGRVEMVQQYSKDDSRDVDVVTRETPTSGHSIGFFEQILGNLGGLGGGGL